MYNRKQEEVETRWGRAFGERFISHAKWGIACMLQELQLRPADDFMSTSLGVWAVQGRRGGGGEVTGEVRQREGNVEQGRCPTCLYSWGCSFKTASEVSR